MLRPGGTAIVVGLAPAGIEVSLPAIEFLSEKTITGSYYGSTNVHAALGRLVQLVVDGAARPGRRGPVPDLARRSRGRARPPASWPRRAVGDRHRRAARRGGGVTHDDLDGRVGEGWGGAPGANGSHVNVVLARRGTPTAAAILGTLTTPTPGHTPILVVVGEDQPSYEPVWPPTIMINKATATRGPPRVADVGRGAAGDRAGRARRGRRRPARADRRRARVRVRVDRPGRVGCDRGPRGQPRGDAQGDRRVRRGPRPRRRPRAGRAARRGDEPLLRGANECDHRDRTQRLRLPLDPPFYAAWDPDAARASFEATIVRVRHRRRPGRHRQRRHDGRV